MSDYSGVIANKEERIEMEIKRTNVTPDLAKKLLSVNYEGQRNISKAHVKKLASDMANGRWVENGSTIVISKSGKLIDGQHRLQAVIDSGCTVPMCICSGVEDEAYVVIDSGKKRSTGDAIGGKNANVKGSLASACAKLAAGGGYQLLSKAKALPRRRRSNTTKNMLMPSKMLQHITHSFGISLARHLRLVLA